MSGNKAEKREKHDNDFLSSTRNVRATHLLHLKKESRNMHARYSGGMVFPFMRFINAYLFRNLNFGVV
jgi:hypothetical protein